MNFINNNKGTNSRIDIEDVLWHLQELRKFLRNVGNQDNIVGWFAAGQRLGEAIGRRNDNFGQFLNLATQGQQNIDGLTSSIHQLVYEFYRREPLQEELAKTWTPLLEPLYRHGYRVELATTNYDVVLENALDEILDPSTVPLVTGRVKRNYPLLDTSLWDASKSARSGYGLLTKLHGSVDWRRGPDGIYTGTPLFSGRHDEHIIIYPGFKGRPELPEFQAFHVHFGRTLEMASAVVVIGFAFRDDYINEICRQQFNGSAIVVVLNPDSDLVTPFPKKRVVKFSKEFKADTTKDVSSLLIDSL